MASVRRPREPSQQSSGLAIWPSWKLVSRNPAKWDGPHPDNFSRDTFDLIVQSTREIIDAVKPQRTFYALETMPWIFPSSPDEYLELIKAIDPDLIDRAQEHS